MPIKSEVSTDQTIGQDCLTDQDVVARCEQAEENLQFTQFAIDNFWDAIVWTRADGTINYVNDTACRLLNYTRPELVTRTITDISPSIAGESWAEYWQAIKKDQSRTFESELYASDGRPIPVRISATYMAFKKKEYSCFLIQNLSDQHHARAELLKFNENLEQLVAQRTASLTEEIEGREKIESMLLDEAERIQNILDNAGQGFLTFGKDLKIDLECSEECRIMFQGEIWGRQFPELLYPDDQSQREFLTSVLKDIFVETDQDKHDVYLSLLPTEISLGGDRFIEVMYREISGRQEEGRKLMAILTDVTETRRLRDQVEQEKKTMKMVVRAVVQHKELSECLKDYEEFCSRRIDQILQGPESIDEKFYEIYRHVHTFKGTFSQLDLILVVASLNGLESRLSKLCHGTAQPELTTLKELLCESDMANWLEADLTVLKDTLGQSFFSGEKTLDIKSSQITEIEDAMISLLPPTELRQLLPRLRQLRYCPFNRLLRYYPEYVERLSDQLQKPIAPMTIEGDDTKVDPEQYRDFTKTLVHVFRNAVDHGIESEETRLARGKDACGQVKCCVSVEGRNLLVKISDDGGGIEIEKVRQKAVTQGRLDPETAEAVSEDELLQLIFEDEISTRETPTEYSGRGMGLSAVKKELELLGGRVAIQTAPGQGTTYLFSVPIIEDINLPKTSTSRLMDTVTQRANRYMMEEMALTIDVDRDCRRVKTDRLDLDGVVALIRLQGTVAGLFAMSFEYDLARYLVGQFAEGELTEDEEDEYLADTMGEISNIVLGSTLNALPQINSRITISTPTTCATTTGVSALRFEGSEMLATTITTNKGKYTINLLMSDGN